MTAEPPAGSAVLELVAVMDRLRSPGGCPWDREQTHTSLARHLLEETYEVLDALDSGDREHLREELGDLLLQVVFHARLAQEHPDQPWGIDDVARGIVDKLVARHPHVFGDDVGAALGDDPVDDTGDDTVDLRDLEASWERHKAAEKRRASVLDGIPAAMPALARADKVFGRVERSGLELAPVTGASAVGAGAAGGDGFGDRLLALVAEARSAGVDPEAALRRATGELAARVAAAETGSTPPA